MIDIIFLVLGFIVFVGIILFFHFVLFMIITKDFTDQEWKEFNFNLMNLKRYDE